MKQKLKLLWKTMRQPSTHISLGVLTLGGFIAGILFWGGFNTALEVTNTETFCISCHEMQDNVYQELQQTVHWANRTGVRATCPDCHVPHEWTNKVARKVQASKELWGTIFGTINTREKFLEKRLTLAQHEWARLSANNSLECRNCHDYDSMDFDAMSEKGRIQMRRAAEQDQSCISCHKGIAHELPDLLAASSEALGQLEQQASGITYDEGNMYYTVRQIPVYLDSALQSEAGHLNPATPVKLVASKDGNLQVEITAWRKTKGFGRVLNEDFGFNISSAVLSKESAQSEELVKASETREDDLTGLKWEQVTLSLWIKPGALMDSVDPIWQFASETYDKSCSVCHTQPDENHFDANSWPGQFNGMLSFVNLDGETQALVLKYLQKHSSDFDKSGH